ncbi:MAG TPA: hypothetical protein VGC58_02985 [Candidatus Paceibacterota bacterium]
MERSEQLRHLTQMLDFLSAFETLTTGEMTAIRAGVSADVAEALTGQLQNMKFTLRGAIDHVDELSCEAVVVTLPDSMPADGGKSLPASLGGTQFGE